MYLGAFAIVTVHQPQLVWSMKENGAGMRNVCGMSRVAGRMLTSQGLCRMVLISLESSYRLWPTVFSFGYNVLL